MDKTHNVFISHFGKDDDHVQRLKQRYIDKGFNVRNSSIDSTKHTDGRRPPDQVVRRLLRRQISWAGKFICLIGEKTHTRPWVNYEIRQAFLKGKEIVGIYKHGCNNSVRLPEAFKKYGGDLVGWNSIEKVLVPDSDGKRQWENPDSTISSPISKSIHSNC